jgi:hypothetical protein
VRLRGGVICRLTGGKPDEDEGKYGMLNLAENLTRCSERTILQESKRLVT